MGNTCVETKFVYFDTHEEFGKISAVLYSSTPKVYTFGVSLEKPIGFGVVTRGN